MINLEKNSLEENLKLLHDYHLFDGEVICFVENGIIKQGTYIDDFNSLGAGCLYIEENNPTKQFKPYDDSFCLLRIMNLKAAINLNKKYSLYELYKLSLQKGDQFSLLELKVDYYKNPYTYTFTNTRTLVYDGDYRATKYETKTKNNNNNRMVKSYSINKTTGIVQDYGNLWFATFILIDSYILDKIHMLIADYIKEELKFTNTRDFQIHIMGERVNLYNKLPALQESIVNYILTIGRSPDISF